MLRHVLHLAARIGEPKVNVFDLMLLDQIEYLRNVSHGDILYGAIS
jgi:hypothetical protein